MLASTPQHFTMFLHSNLPVLIFLLTLHGQVYTGKVIGGHEAVPHSRPYMAFLEIKTCDNSTKYCDGFLLNEDFVMTAAHCQAKNPSSYNILLGVHDYFNKTEVQQMTVKQLFPHEKFNATWYKNDIMLLKLSTPAKVTNNVKPIALADEDDIVLPASCIVSGWGQTNRENKAESPVLTEAKVTLIYKEICKKDNEYCSEGDHGPGMGDSGGPLVCQDGKAYGVVSASRTFGTPLYKYTKIPDKREWISKIMTHH